MDETPYIIKSEDFKHEPEDVKSVETHQVYGDSSQSAAPGVQSKEDTEEILPGDVHSALGHHDPSNGGIMPEGDNHKLVVNEDARRDPNFADRPAGYPVFQLKKDDSK